MSTDLITKAYLATEEEFLSLVKSLWEEKPQIASVGSCCLVGVVCNGYLYIANVGDSRAVLGKLDMSDGLVKAIQLSSEHNACYESVREELQSLHPDDPQIVVLKHNVWRVKGLIQVKSLILLVFSYIISFKLYSISLLNLECKQSCPYTFGWFSRIGCLGTQYVRQ